VRAMGPLEAVEECLVEQLVDFPMHIKGNALEHTEAIVMKVAMRQRGEEEKM
jgi:hypothetical protein